MVHGPYASDDLQGDLNCKLPAAAAPVIAATAISYAAWVAQHAYIAAAAPLYPGRGRSTPWWACTLCGLTRLWPVDVWMHNGVG